MVADVELNRAVNALSATLNDQRSDRPDADRLHAIVTGVLFRTETGPLAIVCSDIGINGDLDYLQGLARWCVARSSQADGTADGTGAVLGLHQRRRAHERYD